MSLWRRSTAEFVGTFWLVLGGCGSAVLGSVFPGLSVGFVGIALAFGLTVYTMATALGPISGAHFNPVVTMADRILGGMSTGDSAVYVVCQIAGACLGAMAANIMFELPAVDVSTHVRSSGALWFSEFIATFGLLIVILGLVRAGRASLAPFAVGGYIAAAYWFTSSTSFANPAVTIARTLSNTFAGIAPESVPAFVVMQIIGALAAVALMLFWHPHLSGDNVVVPHEAE
jgi:arsenate reductase